MTNYKILSLVSERYLTRPLPTKEAPFRETIQHINDYVKDSIWKELDADVVLQQMKDETHQIQHYFVPKNGINFLL